ncbi:hypothetical protein D3C81_988120 [compost metagenome]
MVNDLIVVSVICCCQILFCNCHTDCHSNTLAQWSSRCIYAGSVPKFRVTWSQASPLTELFKIINSQSITAKVQQAVEKHRTMSSRQYETVTVDPSWVIRIVVHCFCEQLIAHRSRSHRHARVTGVCFLNCIDRQGTNGGNRQIIDHVVVSYFLDLLSHYFVSSSNVFR